MGTRTMENAEHALLSFGVKWWDEWNKSSSGITFEPIDVPVPGGHVHMVQYKAEADEDADGVPLVLLHGFGSGVGIYNATLPVLRSRWRGPIYALDWFGMGRSARPEWPFGLGHSADAEAAEAFFVEPLEAWRQSMGFSKMVLAGHSIGGYLSGCYTTRYPQHVAQLLLISPAGMSSQEQSSVNHGWLA